ncbi:protein-tyrosine phosphatase-like protein, partial [Mycena pura]
NTTPTTLPQWLSKQTASHQKYLQSTLEQREYYRAVVRSFYPRQLQPPPEIPRPLFEYYSIASGCHPDNSNKNRYRDIKPYDRTRVVVAGLALDRESPIHCCPNQRYLNASWVQERYGHKWWIASQAPLPTTAHAYLSLILQPITLPLSPPETPPSTRVRTVVQLTQLIEGGRRKADSYFPARVGQSLVHAPERSYPGPPLVTTLLDSVRIPEACCVKSTVSISLQGQDSGESPVTFQHLLFTAWPDQGVPKREERKHLMAFLHLVDSTNRQGSEGADTDPPVVVGCSAGIGRTGTFIALSSLLRAYGFLPAAPPSPPLSLLSPLGPLPSAFDEDLVGQEVDWLREQRHRMVQQDSQLALIYSLLEAAF